MMSPRLDALGIGITTKDRWDDLAVTLSELKMKGYEDSETIVIDDGSSDRTLDVARQFESNCVMVVRQENQEGAAGVLIGEGLERLIQVDIIQQLRIYGCRLWFIT